MYFLLMPRQPLKSNFSGLDLIDEETRKNLTDPYNVGVFESIFSNQNSLRQCVNTILLEFDKLEEELQKMKEWEKSNEPRMKEFESKMKAWEESQGPKLKAFEEIIKQWELANQPRMEEFQKRMEVWQKEQQARRQEFQLLLQEELKKGKN